MSHRTLFLDERLYDYMLRRSLRQSPLQRELLDTTATMEWAGIESSPEQVQFLVLLVQLMQATRCIELGVFTGYSTLAIAMALPSDGHIIACDIDASVTAVATTYWRRAGISEKIDLRIAPAITTLDELIAAGQSGTFDFAYIDADKANAEIYYERVLTLIRPNGLIVIDNVLWGGMVADPDVNDRDTQAVRALNARIAQDDRVDLSVIPIGDGLTLVRKRPPASQDGGRP